MQENFNEAQQGKRDDKRASHLFEQFYRHWELLKTEYKDGLIKQEKILGERLQDVESKYLDSYEKYLETSQKVENCKNNLVALLSPEDQIEFEKNYASTRALKDQEYWQAAHSEQGIKQLIGFIGQPIYLFQEVSALTLYFGSAVRPMHTASMIASIVIDYKYLFLPSPSLDLVLAEKKALETTLREKPFSIDVVEETVADIHQQIADGLIQLSKDQETPDLAADIISGHLQKGFNYQFSTPPSDIKVEDALLREALFENYSGNDDVALADIIKNTLNKTSASLSVSAYGNHEMPAIPEPVPPPKQRKGFFRVFFDVVWSAAHEYLKSIQIGTDGSAIAIRDINHNSYPIYYFNPPRAPMPVWSENEAGGKYFQSDEKKPKPTYFSAMKPTFTTIFSEPEAPTCIIPFLPGTSTAPQIKAADPLTLAIQSTYEPRLDPNLYSSFLGSNQPAIYRIPAGLGQNFANLDSQPLPRFEEIPPAFAQSTQREDINPIFQPTEMPPSLVPFSSINPNFLPMAPELGKTLDAHSALPSALLPQPVPLPLTSSQIPAPNPALQPSTHEPVLAPDLYCSFMGRSTQPLIFSQSLGATSSNDIKSEGILSNGPKEITVRYSQASPDDKVPSEIKPIIPMQSHSNDNIAGNSDSFSDLHSSERMSQYTMEGLHETEELAKGVGLGLLYSLNDGIEGIKKGVQEGNRKFWAGEDWELTKFLKKLPSVLTNPEPWQLLRKEISDVAEYIEDDVARLQRRETTKLGSFFEEVYSSFEELPPRQKGEVIGRGLFFIAPQHTVVKPFMAASRIAGTMAELSISYSTTRISAFFDTYAIRSPITVSFEAGKLYSFPGQLDLFNFQNPLIRKMAQHELPIYQSKFKGELIAQYSSRDFYNGLEPMIPIKHAENFYGWNIDSYRLLDRLGLYRGGNSMEPLSRWHTIIEPPSEIILRYDSAVCAEWYEKGVLRGGSVIDTIWHIEYDKGSIIHLGIAGYQREAFLGGTSQIYIANPWDLTDVKILGSRSLEGDSLWNQKAHAANRLFRF